MYPRLPNRIQQTAIKRPAFVFAIFIFLFSLSSLASAQELRSTTAVQSASESVTIDLTSVSDLSGAAISIRNSSPSTVVLPQISTPGNQPPLNGSSILARLSNLPAGTDQERAIQAWQFVKGHTYHFCYAGNSSIWTYDPVVILNGFGFGCCEQRAYALAWIWNLQGYQARLASLSGFHTIPEVFYGNAWHMLDPDHEVYYLNPDQTIASVQDVLKNPAIVAAAVDSSGNDPVGWSGKLMADLYVQAGPTLMYLPSLSPSPLSTFSLRRGESMTLASKNQEDKVIFFSYGDSAPAATSVNSIQFDWNLTFADSGWKQLASATSGVNIVTVPNGPQYLMNASGSAGYVTYRESSLFPVFSLRILAQLAPGSGGSLRAYYSDGTSWSNAVAFQPSGDSSFDVVADLSALAAGASTYYVKIELNGPVQLHRLRISPVVQAASVLFPGLQPGRQNQLVYQDASPASQARSLKLTTAIPTGKPLIRGVHALSLVSESSTYSLAPDYAAANLVDGDPDSLAYPGSSHIDYVIQLNGTYKVAGVSVDWGRFGTDPRYVQSWQILGRIGDQDWQQLAGGGYPGQDTMDVALNVTATELRLVASSSNWVGAYEVRAFGTALPSTLTVAGVWSNVLENPVYSIAGNYAAANLIDGNTTTLAYPGSKNLDYQVSLGGLTHLSSATITWGYFGTNPGYVDSWSLVARNGAGQWTTLIQGSFPNSATTEVNLDSFATDVRILASSSTNWIGVYDLSLTGGNLLAGLTATSNIAGSPNCGTYSPASNLVDGNENSSAYPCAIQADYTVDPGASMYVDRVKVLWGYFGSDAQYIQSWKLLGQLSEGGAWQKIATGEQPGATETVIPVPGRYRKLRVTAAGTNWIGIYEVQVFGKPIGAGQMTVKSNVAEDPVYSIASGYQAANLIDGNPNSLAYPGSKHIDYQVSFTSAMQLSSAIINWGRYGSNPIYVSSWSLLARSGPGQAWVTLTGGGFPNSPTTLVNLDYAATDVRLVADSANWIGVYEVQFNTAPLQ